MYSAPQQLVEQKRGISVRLPCVPLATPLIMEKIMEKPSKGERDAKAKPVWSKVVRMFTFPYLTDAGNTRYAVTLGLSDSDGKIVTKKVVGYYPPSMQLNDNLEYSRTSGLYLKKFRLKKAKTGRVLTEMPKANGVALAEVLTHNVTKSLDNTYAHFYTVQFVGVESGVSELYWASSVRSMPLFEKGESVLIIYAVQLGDGVLRLKGFEKDVAMASLCLQDNEQRKGEAVAEAKRKKEKGPRRRKKRAPTIKESTVYAPSVAKSLEKSYPCHPTVVPIDSPKEDKAVLYTESGEPCLKLLEMLKAEPLYVPKMRRTLDPPKKRTLDPPEKRTPDPPVVQKGENHSFRRENILAKNEDREGTADSLYF